VSVSALQVINEAALQIGDKDFSRVTRPDWRIILNNSCRDLARKLRLVRWTATFDIEDEDEYALPSDCIQVISMRWNATPDDKTTWWWLEEMFEDEWRSQTHGSHPTGDPRKYLALNDTFHLFPIPESDVVGGGKIVYWGLPDEVTDETTQPIPIMDMLRDTLRERMVIYGLRRLDRFDKADAHEREWQASLTSDRDRLEDRAVDRRSRLRTGPRNYGER
jgi:hypothetical protein